MPKTMWRLQGATDQVVECCIDQTAARAHAVTVVLDSQTFLHEGYPDESRAMSRAMQLRDWLLKDGGWTVAADAAVERSTRCSVSSL